MTAAYWTFFAARWAIRAWALLVVPRRRTAGAARAWLLLFLLEPVGGAVLYAFFGRAYLPRERLRRQEEASAFVRAIPAALAHAEASPAEVRPDLRPAALLAERLGDFPVVGGNGIEVVDDYQAVIDRLEADVESARSSAHLLFYLFEPDQTGQRVARALERAAARGVRCRLLLDGLASRPALRRLAPRLRAAGVEVLELLRPGLRGTRRDLRNHRKLAILDGRVAWIGSQNVVDAFDYKGRGLTNEELMVRTTGPVVHQLQAIFLTDRFVETGERLVEAGQFPPPLADGSVLAQALPSGPTYRVANNERVFVQLIHGARERVVVAAPYVVPDEPFLVALQAAAARGLDVRLVAPRQRDQWLVRLAQESFYEALLRSGVKVHLYRPRFLHAKLIAVDDDVVAIGSSNVDLRSFSLNEEAMLLVYDAQVAARLGRIVERYLRDSEALDLAAWRRRPFRIQAAQHLARMVDSIL